MKIQLSVNQFILLGAVFILTFANVAFFRNLGVTFAGQPYAWLHMASVAVVLFCVLILFLLLFSSRRLIKPALMVLFLLSAVTAYFMDTYNLVIDRDMLANVLATDTAESADLLTPKLLMYVLLMGLAPSWLIWDIPVRKKGAGYSFKKGTGYSFSGIPKTEQEVSLAKLYPAPFFFSLSRLKLGGGALLTMLVVVLISSSFYASFVREHKILRYYANPLTPLYSVYKYVRESGGVEVSEVIPIGTDAHILPADTDRELVIMVLGETARSDRFSLNGYSQKTNPRLEQKPVISFSNVAACGTSTAVSVPCMFDREDREDFSNAEAAATHNVLDVLEHAGVTVLWRDNNSDSKGVATRVSYENFRDPEINPLCDVECRDEGMLAGLQSYIDRHPEGDLLIVLHQMGSHGPAYFKRYPDEFRKFTPTCDSSQLDSCSREEISNSYDNTILYTDHFLAEVIELLRSNDDDFETAMFYASDHGESLGENGVYLHGLPYWMAPESQTSVPMIFWFGKNYDDVPLSAMREIRNASLSHDSVFHTLLGLFEVQCSEYQEAKDLLHLARAHVNRAFEESELTDS